MKNFNYIKESLEYSKFLQESDWYLDQDEYQFCVESGLLDVLMTDYRLLTEGEVRATDKYRELESRGKRWLKYGLGGLVPSLPAGIYHSIKHRNPKYALAAAGSDAAIVASGGALFGLGLIYMWWQRKSTDVCNNKCDSNSNACYYQCYISATDKLLQLIKRDLDDAKKNGKSLLASRIRKKLEFYQNKRNEFTRKLELIKQSN